MRSSTARAVVVAGAVIALAAGCSDAFAPVTVGVPDSLVVQARAMHSALLEWTPVLDENVIGYRIERRSDFEGPFVTVAEQVPQSLPGPLFYLDNTLEAETFYGYRLRVIDRFGGVSEPSIVRGARTPPPPSILLSTVSSLEGPLAADADGYTVVIRNGTDSVVGPVLPNGERRFGPLKPGAYTVSLSGIASNCAVTSGPPTVPATVTDAGLETLTRVLYGIACTDPSLGRILARVVVNGENRDSNGYRLRLDGVHPAAPDSLRVTTDTARLSGPNGGQREWVRLRPGDFQVAIEDVHPKCASDAPSLSAQVGALSYDTLTFTVTCPTPPPPDTTTPWPPGYRLSNSWSAVSGGQVTLTVSLDMGAFNSPAVNGAGADDILAIQGSTRFDSTRLRFASGGSVTGSGLSNAAVNGSTAGVVEWGNFTTQAAKQTGQQGVVRLTFDVIGTGSVTTRTELSLAESQESNDLLPNVVIRESSVNLSGGGGGGGNTPPVAVANGPYSGQAGTAITFSGAGSNDPGGSIASYSWTFSDGGTASGVTAQHVFAAAGSYQATLTVTDNGGLTASATATVTVAASGGGGGNTPPVAVANGPYFGTAGTNIVFNAAGSNDPNGGSIVSYSWSFGDGGTASGAMVQHAYAAAGSYTATLTVTDNGGLSASATASVSVAPAGGGGGATPFTWTSTVSGAPKKDSIVTLTVTLDLSANIPETPGIEELQSYVVDSLTWNPAVLQYFSFNHGSGGFGSVQQFPSGRLTINGQVGPANRSGVITIAVIRFKVLANPGTAASLTTHLGALTGTAATGSFGYRSRTRIVDASFVTQ